MLTSFRFQKGIASVTTSQTIYWHQDILLFSCDLVKELMHRNKIFKSVCVPVLPVKRNILLAQIFGLWCNKRTKASVSRLFTMILLAPFLDAIIAWRTIRVSASSWLEWRGRYSDVVSFVVIMALSFSPPLRNTVSPSFSTSPTFSIT